MENAARSRAARRVLVVGVGDDGPAGLSQSVLDRVQNAELLVGGRRHLDLFGDVKAERVVIAGDLDAVIERIQAEASRRDVVVLASGDPCFFGIGPLLAKRLGRDRVKIVPHVSSVALAFARLGLGWQDTRVVSAHGRPLDTAILAALGARKLAMLTDPTNTPARIASALLVAGAQDTAAWVFEHLGGAEEKAHESTLHELTAATFAALNVLVVPELSWQEKPSPPTPLPTVGEGGPVARLAGFGLPEATYEHSAGLITKPEVRAVSLSKLRLAPGGVLWDVGAGSGSLAIEAAGLVPGLMVYAVERSAQQVGLLRGNIARFERDTSITVVEGEAPEALAALADPDAVFVGGSGGRLAAILDSVGCRLARHGRIVANLVTYEHVGEILQWGRAHGWQAEIVQVSVARGTDILGLTRLQAENPVTIVTLARAQ